MTGEGGSPAPETDANAASGPTDRDGLMVNDDLLTAFEATRQPQFRAYEPRDRVVVLGAAGDAATDVRRAEAAAAGVAIRRRRGGGGTVLLGPGQVVVALVTEVDHPYRNRQYARTINGWLIDALHGHGVRGIEQRGISDLAIADRKIAGTSVFRRRRILFYQASLLVDNDPAEFERFLAFPRQVPAYRRGRSHAAFCTTLAAAGYPCCAAQVATLLHAAVAAHVGGLR